MSKQFKLYKIDESAIGSDKVMSAGYYFVPITDVSIKTESKKSLFNINYRRKNNDIKKRRY